MTGILPHFEYRIGGFWGKRGDFVKNRESVVAGVIKGETINLDFVSEHDMEVIKNMVSGKFYL